MRSTPDGTSGVPSTLIDTLASRFNAGHTIHTWARGCADVMQMCPPLPLLWSPCASKHSRTRPRLSQAQKYDTLLAIAPLCKHVSRRLPPVPCLRQWRHSPLPCPCKSHRRSPTLSHHKARQSLLKQLLLLCSRPQPRWPLPSRPSPPPSPRSHLQQHTRLSHQCHPQQCPQM